MTTFIPRAPYSQTELDQLYPTGLQLQLVQVVSHHDCGPLFLRAILLLMILRSLLLYPYYVSVLHVVQLLRHGIPSSYSHTCFVTEWPDRRIQGNEVLFPLVFKM